MGAVNRQSRREFLLAAAAAFAAASARAQQSGAANADGKWRLPEKRPFKSIENTWIPMRDGTRLAMRLWLPENAERDPVPVVLEYIPYRKRDGTRSEDEAWASAFVPYGFA